LYQEDTALALGRGFEPTNLTAHKIHCIDFTETRAGGPRSVEFDQYYLHDAQDLFTTIGVDSGANASFIYGNISAKMSSLSEQAFRSDRFTVAIVARINFGECNLGTNPNLNADAMPLLDRPNLFRLRCGRQYVQAEKREALAFLTLTASGSTRRLRDTLNTEIGGGMGSGPVQVSASSRIWSELKVSAAQESLQLHAFSVAGGSLQELVELSNKSIASLNSKDSTNPYGAMAEALKQYLRDFDDPKKAVPTEYYVANFSDFFGVDIAAHDQNSFELLKAISEQYRELVARQEEIKRLKNGTSLLKFFPQSYPTVGQQMLDHYLSDEPLIDDYLQRLGTAHTQCLAGNNCVAPRGIKIHDIQPDPLATPTIRWEVDTGIRDGNGERVLVHEPDSRFLVEKERTKRFVAVAQHIEDKKVPQIGLDPSFSFYIDSNNPCSILTGTIEFVGFEESNQKFTVSTDPFLYNCGNWPGLVWMSANRGFENSIIDFIIQRRAAGAAAFKQGILRAVIKDKFGKPTYIPMGEVTVSVENNKFLWHVELTN